MQREPVLVAPAPAQWAAVGASAGVAATWAKHQHALQQLPRAAWPSGEPKGTNNYTVKRAPNSGSVTVGPRKRSGLCLV